jgi:hypothetical protein
MKWSTGITVLYLCFVALILTLVFTCFGETVELESKDYYARELRFQDQIDAQKNALSLKTPITAELTGRAVTLHVPAELGTQWNGEAHFFRPSDASLDRTVNFTHTPGGNVLLSSPGLEKGMYRLRISIASGDSDYYIEKTIYLN